MPDQETPDDVGGERGKAVGYSVVHFNDGTDNMELIGFAYFDTEEGSITWHWDDPVVVEMVTIPLHRIKLVESRFEATGEPE